MGPPPRDREEGHRRWRPEGRGDDDGPRGDGRVETTKVLATCAEKDRPEATARHEMATKADAIDDPTVRRVAMAHPQMAMALGGEHRGRSATPARSRRR